MPLMLTRGPTHGECNICGAVGPLTDDHTPPKSCVRPTDMVLRHVAQVLNAEKPETRGQVLQNGVRYRTLCARCNNHLLGLTYDPALASFCNEVAKLVDSSLVLPALLYVPGFPQRIARAIFGHIAAQGVGRYRKGEHTESMRDWFLDETAPLPVAIRFAYWLYPYRQQILMRDAAIMHMPTSQGSMVWMLKFYPMAWAMFWDPKYPALGVRDLNPFLHLPPTNLVDISVDVAPIIHPRWPEAPTDETFLLMGAEALAADQKKPRARP